MGWSLYAVEKELNAIFKERKKKYSATYIASVYPQVIIDYEGEMSLAALKAIVALFPEFVYVNFHPGTLFSVGTRTGIAGVL